MKPYNFSMMMNTEGRTIRLTRDTLTVQGEWALNWMASTQDNAPYFFIAFSRRFRIPDPFLNRKSLNVQERGSGFRHNSFTLFPKSGELTWAMCQQLGMPMLPNWLNAAALMKEWVDRNWEQQKEMYDKFVTALGKEEDHEDE